jgi:hypothetical protein
VVQLLTRDVIPCLPSAHDSFYGCWSADRSIGSAQSRKSHQSLSLILCGIFFSCCQCVDTLFICSVTSLSPPPLLFLAGTAAIPDASHAYPVLTSFIVPVDVSLDDAPCNFLFTHTYMLSLALLFRRCTYSYVCPPCVRGMLLTHYRPL